MQIITRQEAKAMGLKRFYTGTPCAHGHLSERYVSSNGCAQCLLEREKRLCAQDPEYAKRRQAARTARQAARMKRYKADEAYYKWYCEDQRRRHKERLASDPEYAPRCYQASRNWFKKNPEAARTYAARRRKILSKSRENYTPQDVVNILKLQKGKCCDCGRCLKKGYHVDHIMPLSLGGDNSRANIQCLCPTCNVRKHNKHPIDWAQENGRLL